MKRTLLIAVLLIAAIVLSGCSLIQGIFFGEDEPRDLFYGLEEVGEDLYAADWENDRIVSVGGETIPTGEKPHGFAWDQESNTAPDFWVADVNGGEVYKTTGDESVAMGADIVSVETGGDKIFVADRLNDEIYVYELQNDGSFTTKDNYLETIELDLNSSVGVGYIDMFYHDDGTREFLYVVSDEMKGDDFGFLEIELTYNSEDNTIEEYEIVHSKFDTAYNETEEKDFGALGIVYDEARNVVFVNTGGRIIAYDDTGESVIADLHEDAGTDFNGAYIDLVLSDTPYGESEAGDPADFLYVASGLDAWQDVTDDTPHHILRYKFETDQADSLVYDGTIVF